MKIKESEAPAVMRLYSPLVGAFYDSEDHCTSMDGYALSGYIAVFSFPLTPASPGRDQHSQREM